MKKTLKIDLPERPALAVGLVLRVPEESGDAVRQAEARVADARREAVAAIAVVDRVRQDVASGRATGAELERALLARSAAALVVGPAEMRVVAAKAELAAATTRATQDLLRVAAEWRNELQAVADQLTVPLEELKLLEAALDEVVMRLGRKDGVEPLVWPSTLDAEGELLNWRRALGQDLMSAEIERASQAYRLAHQPVSVTPEPAARSLAQPLTIPEAPAGGVVF